MTSLTLVNQNIYGRGYNYEPGLYILHIYSSGILLGLLSILGVQYGEGIQLLLYLELLAWCTCLWIYVRNVGLGYKYKPHCNVLCFEANQSRFNKKSNSNLASTPIPYAAKIKRTKESDDDHTTDNAKRNCKIRDRVISRNLCAFW